MIDIKRRLIAVLAVVVLVVAAAVIYGAAVLNNEGDEPATDLPDVSLVDTEWILESYGPADDRQEVLPDMEVTLVFDPEEELVGGNAGVNHYTGSYSMNEQEIRISNLIQTLMAGPDDWMAQESAYLGSLADAESYQIEGNRLEIMTGEGELLVFGAR